MSDDSKPGDDGRPPLKRMNDDLAENSGLHRDAQNSPVMLLFAILFCVIFGWLAIQKLNPKKPPPTPPQVQASPTAVRVLLDTNTVLIPMPDGATAH